MQWWLVLGALLTVVLAAIALTVVSRRRPDAPPYVAASLLFSPAERSFLGALDLAVDGRYRVFGKVRVADVVGVSKTIDARQRQGAFNRISAKHFDFVLCSIDQLRVVGVIELDDRSHGARRRKDRDEFLDDVCKSISLPLIRVRAQRAYSTEALREALAVCSAPDIDSASAPSASGTELASPGPQGPVAPTGASVLSDKNPQRCEPTTS